MDSLLEPVEGMSSADILLPSKTHFGIVTSRDVTQICTQIQFVCFNLLSL